MKSTIPSERPRSSARENCFFFIAASLIFAVLYRRFIFGQAVYLFTDIGSDSAASSYPILVMLSRLFHTRSFSAYTLSCGLGADTAGTFLQYVNPLKGFLLLFDRSSMPAGLIIQLYLDTVICAFAAWKYLFLLTDDSRASAISGLLFAYSGYAVLWSQNLSYGVCLTMFALSMLAIEAFALKKTPARFLALAGILAIYLFTNYFFCYMTALFVIIYLPVRAFFRRDSFGDFLKGYLLTGLSAVSALALSAAAVTAIAGSFLGSVRTGDASMSVASLFRMGTDPQTALTLAARIFSENMTGIGDMYTGPANYYEAAALSVGALFSFAFFCLLFRRETALRAITAAAACGAALLLPGLRYIFNMNPIAMRYSFWIALLMCTAVAFFLKYLFAEPDGRILIASAAASLAVFAAVLVLLKVFGPRLQLTLSMRTARFSALFMLFYGAVIIAYGICRIRGGKPVIPAKILPVLLLVAAAGEIIIMRHDTLYLRLYLTKEQFLNTVYSDATYRAVTDLAKDDPDLYRIASTENYFYANEGLVDGFNGTSLYNNTNPASLRTLEKAHGTNEISTPYFMTGYGRYFQFTLLAGRYLVRKEKAGGSYTESALFEPYASYEESGGREAHVYRNKNALPFGYVLKKRIPEKFYMDSDLHERMQLLTEYYFITGEMSGETSSPQEAAKPAYDAVKSDQRMDLAKYAVFSDPHNMTYEFSESGITFRAHGEDPYVYVTFDVPEESGDVSNYFYLKVRTKKAEMHNFALYYLDSPDSEPDPDWIEMAYYNKYYPEYLCLMPDRIAGFRFDIDDDTEEVTVEKMELIRCEDPLAHFRELAESDVKDAAFSNDTYSAVVTTDTDGSVLCVPLLYLKGWTAAVDGREAEVLNVNGGLTGVQLDAGTHSVTLRYRIEGFRWALLMMAAAWVVYLGAWVGVLMTGGRR